MLIRPYINSLKLFHVHALMRWRDTIKKITWRLQIRARAGAPRELNQLDDDNEDASQTGYQVTDNLQQLNRVKCNLVGLGFRCIQRKTDFFVGLESHDDVLRFEKMFKVNGQFSAGNARPAEVPKVRGQYCKNCSHVGCRHGEF